ncbi:hypothetical protein WJX74_008900 [Apatococcus lobatus]|uniref:MIF4G domain-containing protein n=1 Tax=Apatococcus lobatus TaxID=904363 RepID=A0AAW1SGA3_9CHLO
MAFGVERPLDPILWPGNTKTLEPACAGKECLPFMLTCRPAELKQDSDILFTTEDLKRYSAWPQNEPGRACEDLSYFLRAEPADTLHDHQHCRSSHAGIEGASGSLPSGSAQLADVNHNIDVAQPVGSASLPATQATPGLSQDSLDHHAIPAPAKGAATGHILVQQSSNNVVPVGHHQAMADLPPADHALPSMHSLNPPELDHLHKRHAPNDPSAASHLQPHLQDEVPAAKPVIFGSGKLTQEPGAKLQSDPCFSPSQTSQQAIQHGAGSQSSMLPVNGSHDPIAQILDPPRGYYPVPAAPSTEQVAPAGNSSLPGFQLSPAVAAAINPNNPAFDPAIRDSWKAAMAYRKAADRGKRKGRGGRRGRPQKYSTLSRQDHAFYLENAGKDLSADLAYKFNGIVRRLQKEQEAWMEDVWTRYSSDQETRYTQASPAAEHHMQDDAVLRREKLKAQPRYWRVHELYHGAHHASPAVPQHVACLQVAGFVPRMAQLQIGARGLVDRRSLVSDMATGDTNVSKECQQTAEDPGADGEVRADSDSVGRHLARQQQANIVAAASALTTLLTLSAETSGSWQIPVHISHQHEGPSLNGSSLTSSAALPDVLPKPLVVIEKPLGIVPPAGNLRSAHARIYKAALLANGHARAAQPDQNMLSRSQPDAALPPSSLDPQQAASTSIEQASSNPGLPDPAAAISTEQDHDHTRVHPQCLRPSSTLADAAAQLTGEKLDTSDLATEQQDVLSSPPAGQLGEAYSPTAHAGLDLSNFVASPTEPNPLQLEVSSMQAEPAAKSMPAVTDNAPTLAYKEDLPSKAANSQAGHADQEKLMGTRRSDKLEKGACVLTAANSFLEETDANGGSDDAIAGDLEDPVILKSQSNLSSQSSLTNDLMPSTNAPQAAGGAPDAAVQHVKPANPMHTMAALAKLSKNPGKTQYDLWQLRGLKIIVQSHVRASLTKAEQPHGQNVVLRARPHYLSEQQLERTLPHHALADWGAVLLHKGCNLLVAHIDVASDSLIDVQEWGHRKVYDELSRVADLRGCWQPVEGLLKHLQTLPQGHYLLSYVPGSNSISILKAWTGLVSSQAAAAAKPLRLLAGDVPKSALLDLHQMEAGSLAPAPWIPPTWQPCEEGTPQIPDTLPFKPGSTGQGRDRGRGRGRSHGSSTLSQTLQDPGSSLEAAAVAGRREHQASDRSDKESGQGKRRRLHSSGKVQTRILGFMKAQLETYGSETAGKLKDLELLLGKSALGSLEGFCKRVKQSDILDEKVLKGFINQIFEMALTDASSHELCTALCVHLHDTLPQDPIRLAGANAAHTCSRTTLREALVHRSQDACWGGLAHEAGIATRQIDDNSKGQKGHNEMPATQRACLLNLLLLMGHLWSTRKHIFPERPIHFCIRDLTSELNQPQADYMECLCKLLARVGPLLEASRMDSTGCIDQKSTARAIRKTDNYFLRIQILSQNRWLKPEVKSMLKEVIELRARGWVPKALDL